MPTSYTAGILDNSIKSFKEFAMVCARAFGATIHMRDESLDAKYSKRVPDPYYIQKIKEIEEEIENTKKMPDEELVQIERQNQEERIHKYESYIEKAINNKEKLTKILIEVQSWVPPSEEHEEFKQFMIDQLESTIDRDANTSYFEKELIQLKEEYQKGVDPSKIKEEKLNLLREDKTYFSLKNDNEKERCESSNAWIKKLLESIE